MAIDNPELLTKLHEAEAAKLVALADLARIEVGTRAEVIAERKAAVAARRGEPDACPADLRPDQAAHGGGFESVAEARRGDRIARCGQANR